MEITPENAISYQHAEWLNHPVTIQMLQIFKKQREHIVDSMATSSGITGIEAEWFRTQASNIKTLDTVKKWITDTEQFIKQLNNI